LIEAQSGAPEELDHTILQGSITGQQSIAMKMDIARVPDWVAPARARACA
jgi:hypothetical protein